MSGSLQREAAEPQVLEHGHTGQHAASLGHVDHAPADDLVDRQAHEVLSEIAHGAAVRADDTRDRAEECRLARAVGADERDDGGVRYRQAHALDGPDPAVAHMQVIDLEQATNCQDMPR